MVNIDLYLIIALTASLAYSIGAVLQKKGLVGLPELHGSWWFKKGKVQWRMIKEVIWDLMNLHLILGLLASILGYVFYTIAISYGDITIVQPLMGVGNLWIVLLGVFWLKESVKKSEVLGIMGIVTGVVFLFGV